MTEDRSATAANDGTPTTPATVPGLETLSHRLDIRASALEWRLWHLAIVAFVADTALTLYGVQAGHVEGNPIMRYALNSMGVVGIVALKSVALAVAVSLRPLVDRVYRPLVPAAISLPWFAAAFVNVFVVFG